MTRPADTSSLGLALGGGAVLGYSHLGLLQALDEAGIGVDAISGTSAGALVAALHAFDVPTQRARELLQPLRWKDISGFTLTRLGLLSNESITRVLEEELGADVGIEDARIPLAIVAADVNTGEAVILREGSLRAAVQASTALPGLYVPVEIDGRMLVDGGIVELVPVRPLREGGARVVVGATLGESLDFQPVKSIVGVLTNAFLIAVYAATRLDLLDADVLVQPRLGEYKHWDFSQRDALVRKGFEAGRAAVPDIRRALGAAPGTG